MNYKLHYDKLIERARNRATTKSEYFESHHIIPKSVGGTNNKNNLVLLMPEEHIVAHLLLMRIYDYHPKLVQAVMAMTNGFNKSKTIIKNNKSYGFVKRIISKTQSEYLKNNHYLNSMSEQEREKFLINNLRGENNPNYGNSVTDAQKDRLSRLNAGYFCAIDMQGNKFRIKKTDERFLSGELVAESKGRKNSVIAKLTRSDKSKGEKNPNSKEYIVYDENDIVVYNGKGGFVDFISKQGIPLCAVYNAIKNNNRLYQTKRQQTFAYKNGVQKFIGWRFERL